ncbi:MAG: TRAP transporter substrate-binding protein [Proteobacteria bacterium]|nr:TRAP transporter substrate-binding protein [Pseudomonadota bacterium]
MKFIKMALFSISTIMIMGIAGSLQAETWKGWNIHKAGYPNTVAMDKFAELLEQKTNGRIKLKMYHAGVLGSQPDAIEQVRIGALEVGNFNMGPIGPIVAEANVLSLPFIFKDVPHMFRVMNGAGGKKINEGLEKRGLIALTYYDAGARSFYMTKKAVKQPVDVVGMKVRVMNNDLYSGMIAALGGNPSPMAFAEVYQALKTGVVDGAENNWPSYESTGHYEVAKFYSLSQHLIIPECLCINARVWRKLSATDKKLVKAAAVESADLQHELWAKREKVSRQTAVKSGVTVMEIPNKAAFQKAMEPVYDKYLESNPKLRPLVKLIKNTK